MCFKSKIKTSADSLRVLSQGQFVPAELERQQSALEPSGSGSAQPAECQNHSLAPVPQKQVKLLPSKCLGMAQSDLCTTLERNITEPNLRIKVSFVKLEQCFFFSSANK